MDHHFPEKKLLNWFSQNKRPLPWRTHYEPYHVWLSEIMLQQTRVEQALPYYENFLKKFPSVESLAKAPEQSVLKAWEGLGYYSRARNLHKAAKKIVSDFDGKIPNNYNQLIGLPGFGEYVAAAVSSIAFNEPRAVVDGNVFRVLSRYFGIKSDIALSQTKKEFFELANNLIPKNGARNFNQGIMELGALVCTPKNPNCSECPISKNCFAFLNEEQNRFPVKTKKQKRPTKNFAAVLLSHKDGVWLAKRTQKLLNGLYEFPQIQFNPLQDSKKELEQKFSEEFGVCLKLKKEIAKQSHEYTHFKQNVHLFEAEIAGLTLKNKNTSNPEIIFYSKKQIKELPLSKVNQKLLLQLPN